MIIEDYEFSERTAGHILEDKAKTCGDKVYLQFRDEREVTYREFNEIANKIGNGLLSLGLEKGDKVATMLPNSLEAAYIWFGTSKAGLVEVPINLANKGDFLSHNINNSDAKAIVIDRELIDRLKFIEKNLPKLEKVVVWSKTPTTEKIPELRFDVIDYEELNKCSSERPQIEIKSTDAQMILYTSGTTGPSKGVMLSHAWVYVAASDYIEGMRATSEDILFTCLPMFHGNARLVTLYPAMLIGAKVVMYERFSATRHWDRIRKAKATIFNSLGAMANFSYNQPRKANDSDNPARVCCAAPMPPEIYEDFEKRFNLKVVPHYGLTEVAIITYDTYGKPKIGSCGKETKNFEVKIVDENDWPVPPGVVGEIVARGRIPWATSLGYYNMPEKTLELVRNNFHHTGDAGYLDEDGYLYFVDRMKDYIRRRGENISSFEIERVVDTYPKILESVAISVKSELSEDEVMIVIVPEKGEKIDPEELLIFCEERMPYFAVPRYVEFVEKFPKTLNEKIQKNKLREAGITENTWDREKAGYKVKR